MRILLLSRYDRLGASSRVRSFQYLPFLKSMGWEVKVSPLFSNQYIKAFYDGKSHLLPALAGYMRRLRVLMGTGKYNLIWIEKEIFPFMPALFELLMEKSSIPYVVDYDDAIFHRYDRHPRLLVRMALGKKINCVMRSAAMVIAGNDYISHWARQAGAKSVVIVPTVVDLERYKLRDKKSVDSSLVIGWIGSPATTRYLSILEPAFEAISRNHQVRFVAIGADKKALKNSAMIAQPWTEETEVQSIQGFDIGIMPLVDSPWECGKCGYKLIQYMACGLPVVASTVGVNKQIVEHGLNGFLANNLNEWREAFEQLINDHRLRQRMGMYGRKKVEKWYSVQAQVPRLEKLFREILRL